MGVGIIQIPGEDDQLVGYGKDFLVVVPLDGPGVAVEVLFAADGPELVTMVADLDMDQSNVAGAGAEGDAGDDTVRDLEDRLLGRGLEGVSGD